MIKKIEHIGIAVESPEKSNEIFEKLLGETCYKSELVESEGVKTYFYKLGESKIELLQSTKEDSPVKKFITKKGKGLLH